MISRCPEALAKNPSPLRGKEKMGGGALYTEDGAMSAGEALMWSGLLDAELIGTTLEFTVGGADYRQELRPLAKGAYNTVYSVERPPLVVRVSIVPKDEEAEETERRLDVYESEIGFMRRMGDLGIGPRVYAELRLGGTGIGVVTEKLEGSLFDAESCPFLARRAFVDADAEAALVDLYARSSRIFTCIDTKSENVLFNAGERSAWGKITTAPRIAMIDMDASFCKERGSVPLTTTPTTIADIASRLRERDSEDHYLDATCISLLVHCVSSACAGNKAGVAANGFPYARVAVCLYSHWDTVWDLLLLRSSGGDGYEFNAGEMVAAYYHPKPDDVQNPLLESDKQGVKEALKKAVRSPMTRLLLATHGLDVDQRMQLVGARRIHGDTYERLATLRPVSGRDELQRFDDAVETALAGGRLEQFVRECELTITRGSLFRCVHSRRNQTAKCTHGKADWSGAGVAMTPMRVLYSAAAYPENREALSGGPWVLNKRIRDCTSSETARLVCHFLRSQTHTDTSCAYAGAMSVLDERWTGMTLVNMHRSGTMSKALVGVGIPKRASEDLARTIGALIEKRSKVRKLARCMQT